MMVRKCSIPSSLDFSLDLPSGSQILSLQTQRNLPVIWVLVDADSNDIVTRHFIQVGTGREMPTDAPLRYLATYQDNDLALVWHVFEELPQINPPLLGTGGQELFEPCSRCHGSGQEPGFETHGFICQLCGGSGQTPVLPF